MPQTEESQEFRGRGEESSRISREMSESFVESSWFCLPQPARAGFSSRAKKSMKPSGSGP